MPKSLYAGQELIIDGLNNYADPEVYILNRWQQVLFHAKPYMNGAWDGTHNGKPVAEGTYYIIFKSADPAILIKESIYVLGRK